MTFGEHGSYFALDPVPRLIAAEEWERIERGLEQRARALDAFCGDAYGERRVFAEGRLPERLLGPGTLHEPLMDGLAGNPRRRWVDICGFDLARRDDGEMVVLEDNVRTPSGLAYSLAAREVVGGLLDVRGLEPRPVDPAAELLAAALAAAAPEGLEGPPRLAIVTDGSAGPAFYEHRRLAETVGGRLVTVAELESARGRLWARFEREREPIDVLYRRTDDSALTDEGGELTPLGQLTFEPLRAQRLGIVNAFGAGIADDKLAYAYGEEMVRFYLGEEPAIRSIPTYDLAVSEQRTMALERLDRLVVKPRFGLGGEDVLIVGDDGADASDARERILEGGGELIAQDRIPLSTHPCLTDGRLQPRRVDLRAFAYATADGYRIATGGLTRFAADPGAMVVNSSQGGGGKDTWVVG